ncbi:hypothetical protein H4S06_002172 [Coemansia sp. BCRC 34490]|nr:hypothetical protein H4S06_002172 [Coemansia sp. BCRC 34490]
MDDDDANDGDFILNDSEEYDDEDEDDDEEEDEDDNDDDNDDEEGDDDDDEEDENSTSLLSKDGVVTEVPTMLLKPQQILAPGSETMLGASSSASVGDNAWNMTLEQLGLGAGSAAAFSSVLPDTASIRNGGMLIPNATAGGGGNSRNNERMLSSEELLQQLINGVSSDQRNNVGNMSIPCSMPTPSSASLSAWLPSGTDSSILSQWGSSGHNTGAGLDIGLVNGNSAGITQSKLTDELLANLSGPNALLPTAPGPVESGSASTGATQRSTSNIVTTCKPGKNTSLPTEASTSYAVNEKTGYGQKFQQNQRLQDLSASDLMSLARFGQGKTPRKRKKKAAASIAKALSAAAILDADGVMNLEQSGMDTEMSGLYQDALQEGEEIDVQEELLIADNSDYMFTAEQMSQLREQQVQNFQFVTQSFLITCAESGPHGARARHWKRQLDQLALWHSLGTRESPGDMMSSGGLQGFGDLIESAERVRARTGAVGMSESGRFAPNPVSFFAIPGITVVIPEIYEAVDEIHRTTQLCADSSNSDSSDAKGEQYSNDEDKETPRGSSAVPAAASSASEVRSFDGSMCFTSECKCTALKNGFKSAMVRECVFPKLHRQARVRKRKLSADRDSVDGKAQSSSNSSGSSGGGNKHIAIQPQDPAVLSARRNSVSTEQSGLNGGEGLAQLPGARSLAPLTKPVARQISIQRGQEKGVLKHGDGRAASTSSIASGSSGGEHGGGSALLTIMPMMVAEPPPTYTEADIRMIVEEMGAQMHGFKREVHRVPRSRRRIFVQGSDGVARLEWMKVKIEPLLLPATMQGLVDVMVLHSGFQEAMIPKIVVVRKPKNRIHFLDSEDSLLLQGLRLFGLEDVASIRVHLLPCKTASQLRNRMNNLRARRAPPNPVKDFCLRRIAPFTLEEEETLRLGVLVYGDEFKQLDKNFLINRPILALTHVWNHVRNRPSEASSSSPSLSMVKT